jgi:hypothetical protein
VAELPVFSDCIFTATDMQRSSRLILDAASGGLVTITRNQERFALMPRGQLAGIMANLRDTRAENARLEARITELEGRSGYCVECERLARRVEELEAALHRIHEGCCRQLAEPRDHGNDQYCMTDCATVAEEALAAIAARKKEA